jgi:hypothetical protein
MICLSHVLPGTAEAVMITEMVAGREAVTSLDIVAGAPELGALDGPVPGDDVAGLLGQWHDPPPHRGSHQVITSMKLRQCNITDLICATLRDFARL